MEMTEYILRQNEGHVSPQLLLIVSALDRMAAEMKEKGREDAGKEHRPRSRFIFIRWARRHIADNRQMVLDMANIMLGYYMEGYKEQQEVSRMKSLDLPGLRCMGQVTNPDVNHGQPVPLYEPIAPEGRPDINTLEGWNAAAAKANNRAFCRTFGREPVCSDELKAWEKSDFASEFVWIGNPRDRKDFTE